MLWKNGSLRNKLMQWIGNEAIIYFKNMVHRNLHYIDAIMTAMASQITSLTVVYSIVYSGADQRKHQSSASLAFVRGIHRDRWISRTKGQLRGKCFHLMTSSWTCLWQVNVAHTFMWGKSPYKLQGPILLTWFNFNSSLDRETHT